MRLRSHLSNILVLMSAVVCALSLMLVVRSFFRADIVDLPLGSDIGAGVATIDGKVLIVLIEGPPRFSYETHRTQPSSELRVFLAGLIDHGISWLGIGWGDVWADCVLLPLWLVPLLTAIAPLRWWIRRHRRSARGFPVIQPTEGPPAPRPRPEDVTP